MSSVPEPALWRLAGTGTALVGYAIVSHMLMVHAPDRPWSVAALFGPLWAAVALGGWLRRHWPTLVACALVLAFVAAVVSSGGIEDIHLMYVLQHAGIHAALAWVFGASLRKGSVPLITAVAERVHEAVPPREQRYTRKLTQVWALYFVGMTLFSLLLYTMAPWPWWSLYCNLITPLTALLLFVGEHGWRRLRHPEFARVSLLRVLQAYRQGQAGRAPR